MNDCQELQLDQLGIYLEQKAYEEEIPLKGTFELTARCNFNCNMCYIHLDEEQIKSIGRELTNEEWLNIARQAKDAGMLYLTLTGGEVFARPGFRELYEELSQMGFLIQIFSNGYLIDENVVEWLREIPPYMLRFTLYGVSNDTYERVCGIKYGFDRVSHAIDLVQEADIPLYLVSTITKENEKDMAAMSCFAKEKKVIFRATTDLLKPVRGAKRDVEMHRVDKEITRENILKILCDSEQLVSYTDNPLDVCGSYRKAFWITWNGNLQLCGFMSNPIVPILAAGKFDEAWKLLLEQLKQIKKPEGCNNCKFEGFCIKCPGILTAECGDYYKVNEEFCNKARTLYETYRKTNEGGSR